MLKKFWQTVETIVLVTLLALMSVKALAQAPSVPTTTNGNYTVSWSPYYLFLEEKIGSGAWAAPVGGTQGTNSMSFSNKSAGLHSYRAVRFQTYPYFYFYYSPVATTTVVVIPPPSNLTAPATDNDGNYTVSWNSVSGASYYQVQEKIGGGGWSTLPNTNNAFKSFSGKPNNTYQYRVKGCSAVCGNYTTSISVTVLHKPTTPGGINAPSVDNDGSFSISWGAASGVVNNYTLQQQINGSGSWTTIQNNSARTKSFSNLPASDYRFRVKACNGSGCSAYTPTVLVTVGNNGGAPWTPPTPVSKPSMSYGDDSAGAIAGQFRVNEAGAATYSIPIMVAAGTAGVAPEVSLNYSSQAGNGIAGRGWSIGGGSAISRCRQTLQIDKKSLPVQWNSEDRYCLDGQRLLLVSGTYGDDGAVYRTEIDSFAKITSHGENTLNSAYFTVERKDGSTSIYGDNSNSRQLGKGGKTLTWGIRKFTDSFSNPIIFKYSNNPANGFALDKIYYAFGGNTTNTSSNSYIDFIYDTNRPDPTTGYMAGHPLKNKLRLKRIDSYNADDNNSKKLMRSYHLQYKALPSSPRVQDALLTRLESIEECIDTSGFQCMPATSFDWGEAQPIGDQAEQFAYSHKLVEQDQSVSAYTLLDFNGDGLKDVAWMRAFVGGGDNIDQKFHYAKNTGTDFSSMYFAASNVNPESSSCGSSSNPSCYRTGDGPDSNGSYDFYVVDYNADGRDDLIRFREKNKSWQLFLSTPQTDGSWKLKWRTDIVLPFDSLEDIVFGDINSDGLVDAIQYDDYEDEANYSIVPAPVMQVYMLERNNNPETSDTAYSFLLDASYTVPLPRNTSGPLADQVFSTVQDLRVADLNGDGRAELLGSTTRRNGCIFLPPPIGNGLTCTSQESDIIALTFNGSSLTVVDLAEDVIVSVYDSDAETHRDNFTQGDINGDGLLDIVYQQKDNSHKMVALNQGDFSFNHQLLGNGSNINYKTNSLALVDLNSDGHSDLVWHDKWTNQRRISYWQPPQGSATIGAFSSSLQTFAANDDFYYRYQNIDGDAALELVMLKHQPGVDKYASVYELHTLPDGHNSIDTITNGLGAVTNIEYSPLSDTDHYQRIKGLNTVETIQNVCFPMGYTFGNDICIDMPVASVNASDFYRNINEPFYDLPSSAQTLNPEMTAPVLEMFGPSTLVTRVSSSAPAAHDTQHSQVDNYAESAISYVYHQAKIQAAGRGYLGFKKIQSIDEQTGVITSTQYRQDFPFIGMPIKTQVHTADDKLLSESTSEWQLKSYSLGNYSSSWLATAAANGCKALGALQPILTKSVETTYSTTSSSGTFSVSSTPLQTLVTTNAYNDKHGNVYSNVVEHRIGSASGTLAKKQTTTNLYNSTNGWGSEDAKRLGRLNQTTVRHQRWVNNAGDSDITRKSNFTYFALGSGGVLQSETIEQGNSQFQLKTDYTYDARGNKTKAKQTALDAAGLQSGANVRETTWTYDSRGRYVQTTRNAKNHLVEQVLERNQYGAPEWVKNIDGVISETDYTPFGKPYLTYSPNGAWQNTVYGNCAVNCPNGAAFSVTTKQAGGGEATEYFDVLGRSIQTQSKGFNGSTVTTQTEYDNLGRVKRKSQPYYNVNERYWAQSSYDILGRPVQVLTPHSLQPIAQTVTYNGLTTTTSVTAPNSGISLLHGTTQTQVQKSNVLGEMIEVTDSRNGKVKYKYDAQGHLTLTTTTSHSNGGGNANGVAGTINISLSYDNLGRKVAMNDPDKGVWSYDYNGFGELISQVDANGNISSMTYDKLGRMVQRQDYRDNDSNPSTSATTLEANTVWLYDTLGAGRLTKVDDTVSNYRQTYTYDSLGRNNSTTTRTGTAANDSTYTQSVTFDQYGRTFQKFDATGGNHGAQFTYNSQGYLQKISETASVNGNYQTYFTVTQMTARNQVSGVTWGNGYTSVRHYDFARGVPQRLETFAGIHKVQDLEVNFDDFGNLVNRINRGKGASVNNSPVAKNITESFKYDGLNRLRETRRNNVVTQTLTYDSFGNIKNKSDVGTYTYGQTISGSTAGPHAVTNSGDGVKYRYDRNGNMVSDGTNSSANNQRTLIYSGFDKPMQIKKGNHQINFEYGPDRSRYKRIDKNTSSNVVEKTTLYMGNVERITHSNNQVEFKRYIEGQILVTNGTSGTKTQYMIKDYLGSTELVLNHSTSGDIVAEDMSFDAWGQRRKGNNWTPMSITELMNFDSSTTTKGFTGHEMLDEVGLIHMNGRIYDPRLGRFMQADPFIQASGNTQSYNRYSYLFNKPLTGTDPSGYFAFIGWAIASFIVGKIAQAFDLPILATIATIASCIGMDVVNCAAGSFGATYGLTDDLGQAFKAGAIAAVSTWAFTQIGGHFEGLSNKNLGVGPPDPSKLVRFGNNMLTKAQVVAQTSAHAIAGGVMNILRGGKFGHGFIAAGITKGTTNLRLAAADVGGVIGGTIAAATVGGTASKITGGKFSNGAQTAAFQFLYGEFSAAQQKEVPDWHANRNENQQCPSNCAGLDKNQYWEEGQSPLHGGDKGYFTYRGDSSLTKGNQCVYAAQCTGISSIDADIQRIDHRDYAGTYDYIPPTKIGNTNIWNPVTVTGHFFVDVLPYKLWGN